MVPRLRTARNHDQEIMALYLTVIKPSLNIILSLQSWKRSMGAHVFLALALAKFESNGVNDYDCKKH